MNPANGGWLILLTLIGAMLLAVASLPYAAPDWLMWLRPEWAIAAFFFWSVTTPARVGLFSAWFAGLFFDALLGPSYPLGLHGFCFAATVFIGTQFQPRLQATDGLQQAAVLGAIVLGVQIVKSLARLLLAGVDLSVLLPLPALTTILVYPLLTLVLRPLAERYVR